ncbi:MAG: glutamate-ammonia-ligase adenylyltransferase [Planctomycetota bacterium]
MQTPPSPQQPSGPSGASGFDVINRDQFSNWTLVESHLRSISKCGATEDLLRVLAHRLNEELDELIDPDEAIAYLDRFIAASRSPTSLLALFERDQSALPSLLQVFATSQTLAGRLIGDPESFDLMRASDGQGTQRRFLVDEMVSELQSLESPSRAAVAIRKFVSREIIRIAYGEFVRQSSEDLAGRQLSYVADAVLEAALVFVLQRLANRGLVPVRIDGHQVRFTIIGLGQYGGEELAYGRPLKVMFLYDAIEERNESHRRFVTQVVEEMSEIVSADDTIALHLSLDTSFRPLGDDCPIGGCDLTAKRLESDGRTWQRIALTKARVVAGDQQLGGEFLDRLQPWIYRRFLSREDLGEVRSLRLKLRRKLEPRSTSEEDAATPADPNVEIVQDEIAEARGGRNDIELTIQFLQLLHGGAIPAVRVGSTVEAIDRLRREGCLTHQEATLLTKGYAKLCRLQHQLNVMQGHYTGRLPAAASARRRLAWQLGIREPDGKAGSTEKFNSQLEEMLSINRKVLNHLMLEAPATAESTDDSEFAIETELVLDPDPDPDLVRRVLAKHGLTKTDLAIENIRSLATESVRFLPRRRCQHFFSALAPKLLREISTTPDPDRTLRTLANVAESLGAKSSLWELLGNNQATLRLMTRICAATPYLSDLLITTPGMIDELIDSLLMERLPRAERLDARSIELCRRAADLDVVLHGFKDSSHLMIGVRDILGKDPVEATHAALADTAEACLRRILEYEQEQLASRYGDPVGKSGEPAELISLALGKFGGREPNYLSDLDVVFLYSEEGTTQRRVGGPRKTVTNAQFFNQLAAAIASRVNRVTDYGRLYELDGRLRPGGEEGVLATAVDPFVERFSRGLVPLWQQLAMCKARVISGSRLIRKAVSDQVHDAIAQFEWHSSMVGELVKLRTRMQVTASDDNLKRGAGGTVDVEFIAQAFKLRYAGACPDLRGTGTIEILTQARDLGVLNEKDANTLVDNYRTLRGVESYLRLMDMETRHEYPDSALKQRDLAYLMTVQDTQSVNSSVEESRLSNREIFERLLKISSDA